MTGDPPRRLNEGLTAIGAATACPSECQRDVSATTRNSREVESDSRRPMLPSWHLTRTNAHLSQLGSTHGTVS